jgi:hypothetical protein
MTMTELAESTDVGEMIELMSVDSIDQRELAEQLLEQAREQKIELVGPGGLLGQLTKSVFETALDAEMSEHLGYEKHDAAGRGSGNSRNGTRAKTVLTEIGPVEIEVPRDTESTFEPQIVRKRQRHLTGVDEIVLSLTARGLTTGEIAAHFQEVYGARISKDTVSRITEKVTGEIEVGQAVSSDQQALGERLERVHTVPGLRHRDPARDLLNERDRVAQRPLPTRCQGTRALPERHSRTEVPLPRDESPRPHRTRQGTLGNEMEARTQRIRDSVRRKNQLNPPSQIHR